ncbi:MAG TPA: hypothetical protein VIX59_11680 [Candidatus Binataceae bacterium]
MNIGETDAVRTGAKLLATVEFRKLDAFDRLAEAKLFERTVLAAEALRL